jgi:hypothetical protein
MFKIIKQGVHHTRQHLAANTNTHRQLSKFIKARLRPLPTHRTAPTRNKRTQTSMPWVGFESTIPALKRAKTVHTSDAWPLWSAVIQTSVYIYIYIFVLFVELKVLCSGCVLALYTMVQYFHAAGYSGRGSFLFCVFYDLHMKVCEQIHPLQCFPLSVCITEIPDQNHMNSDSYVTTYHTINVRVFLCPVPPPPLSIGDASIQSKASGTLCVQTHDNTYKG